MKIQNSFRHPQWLLLLYISLLSLSSIAQTTQLASPDGKTVLEIGTDSKKQLKYRVLFDKKPLVNWSVLGLRLADGLLGPQTTVVKKTTQTVNETISWPLGENDQIRNHYQELTLQLQTKSTPWQVTARVFNGSVAFRYLLPRNGAFPQRKLQEELTTFQLDGIQTIYQYKEESVFTPTLLDTLQKTCDFPATLAGNQGYLSIGEAQNTTYTKAVLVRGTGTNALAVSFGKDSVIASGDFTTPWRTISFSPTAIGLKAFTDLPFRLSPPASGGVPDWIKPGKLIRASLTTQGGLNCIDFAASHNMQYIMFDAGWYGAEFRGSSDPTQPIPAIDMPKVIQYGKERGIGVILYVNRVALRARLDEILPLYKQWGVAGFKFGFVDGLSQEGLTWLSGAMKKVYDHGFILNIHDNYKPTGLSRTFPNLLTQEGIRGNENNPDAYHNTVLPFTRFLAGAADYTFCYPNNNRYFSDNLQKTKLQVTKGQQLALSVVFFSPLQAIFWYGNPTDYDNEEEIEFFKQVPTVWNESHYLAGEIGQHISVARRKGDAWYVGSVAGLADWSGEIPLDFLEAGKSYKATVYEDGPGGSVVKRIVALKKGKPFSIKLKAKGGQAMIVEPGVLMSE